MCAVRGERRTELSRCSTGAVRSPQYRRAPLSVASGCVQELPQTRAMLNNACDVRLPARLTQAELNQIVDALVGAVSEVKGVTPPEAQAKLGEGGEGRRIRKDA